MGPGRISCLAEVGCGWISVLTDTLGYVGLCTECVLSHVASDFDHMPVQSSIDIR